jgi:hypothetical protein
LKANKENKLFFRKKFKELGKYFKKKEAFSKTNFKNISKSILMNNKLLNNCKSNLKIVLKIKKYKSKKLPKKKDSF